MPLDPQAQALIDSVAGTKPVEQMTVQEMRDGMEERARLTGGEPQPVDQVLSSEVPGPAGPIPVRIYIPGGTQPMPGVMYFPGGGAGAAGAQPNTRPVRGPAAAVECRGRLSRA